jgi:hypothetical protein
MSLEQRIAELEAENEALAVAGGERLEELERAKLTIEELQRTLLRQVFGYKVGTTDVEAAEDDAIIQDLVNKATAKRTSRVLHPQQWGRELWLCCWMYAVWWLWMADAS